MDKLKMHSPDITQQNIDKLLELFPNCKTEKQDANGRLGIGIDFDLLKQELSKNIVEGPQERYQLNWPGKKEALLTANAPIAKTLRPCREDSVDFDTTENLFIEGDNLDALKLLQETYLDKVKMIYIDPPYNTGKDFVYKDNFSKKSQEELIDSGQIDEYNRRLVSNPETAGRYHSNWLSMIYPRLKLARNLLSKEGFVFISIDDNELDNLLKLGAEIFGQENCIGIISWQKVYSSRMDAKSFSNDIDYIVVFRKNSEIQIGREKFEQNEKQFSAFDEKKGLHYRPRGLRKDGSNSRRVDRPNLFYSIESPDGAEIFPIKPDGTEGTWRWSKDRYLQALRDDDVEFNKKDGAWQVIVKQYKEAEPMKPPSTFWPYTYGHNHGAVEELKKLFGQSIFSSPKPTLLLQKILEISTKKEDLVLDFFSGSGSFADAVIQYNALNKSMIKFIQIQLPEPTEEKTEAFKAGFHNICEIGKERIRRAGKKIKEENPDVRGLDTGFRVLKIDSSNMNEVHYTPDSVSKGDLFNQVEHIKTDRSSEDLLFQVMLDWGVDLSLPIRKEAIEGKEVYFVNDDDLVACFDKGVDEALIKALAAKKPLRVVFRDDGFASDSVKINVEQIFKQLAPATDIKAI